MGLAGSIAQPRYHPGNPHRLLEEREHVVVVLLRFAQDQKSCQSAHHVLVYQDVAVPPPPDDVFPHPPSLSHGFLPLGLVLLGRQERIVQDRVPDRVDDGGEGQVVRGAFASLGQVGGDPEKGVDVVCSRADFEHGVGVDDGRSDGGVFRVHGIVDRESSRERLRVYVVGS